MQFLELVETIRAEEASIERLYRGDGTNIRSTQRGPQYMKALAEAAKLVADVVAGRKPVYRLQEALGTADFPYLFGDVIGRQLLGNYQAFPTTYRKYCKVTTVRDFRSVKRFAVNGAEAVLSSVGQQVEYPERKLSDAQYTYAVTKYGARMAFAWEAILNDDLGALTDIPARFGKAAARSEEKFATGLFVDANGPHASFYTSGNKNQIITANGASASNPALSISALQDAFIVLGRQTDSDGEPIVINTVQLVVPPALQVTAENILSATELWLTGSGGVATQQVHTINWMKTRTQLNVNAYIPNVAASANGNTSWFLFADPEDGRPAIEIGFLRGHENPEVFMKAPNSSRVGGGSVDPADGGDFERDEMAYKVRHVFGGTQIDPKMTIASNGSGS